MTGRRLHSPRKTGGVSWEKLRQLSGMLEPRNRLPQTQMLEKWCDLSRRVGVTLKTYSPFLFNPNNYNRSPFLKNGTVQYGKTQLKGKDEERLGPLRMEPEVSVYELFYYCSW